MKFQLNGVRERPVNMVVLCFILSAPIILALFIAIRAMLGH